jgi:hypothetical protein
MLALVITQTDEEGIAYRCAGGDSDAYEADHRDDSLFQ